SRQQEPREIQTESQPTPSPCTCNPWHSLPAHPTAPMFEPDPRHAPPCPPIGRSKAQLPAQPHLSRSSRAGEPPAEPCRHLPFREGEAPANTPPTPPFREAVPPAEPSLRPTPYRPPHPEIVPAQKPPPRSKPHDKSTAALPRKRLPPAGKSTALRDKRAPR